MFDNLDLESILEHELCPECCIGSISPDSPCEVCGFTWDEMVVAETHYYDDTEGADECP